MKQAKWILAAILAAGVVYAQDAPKGNEAPADAKAKEVLQKTLAGYGAVKTYQGAWSFTIQRGAAKSTVAMDIKVKTPSKLYFRVAPTAAEKPVPGQDPIPEMLVVMDGKNAYFQNANAALYYKVALQKNTQIAAAWMKLVAPQIPAASQVELKEEKQADGKAIHVLEAPTIDGGITRMEIAADGFRIRRILSQKSLGPLTETSTITVDKETFDADISDREFNFKPAKNAKEVAAPVGTEALFGPPVEKP